MGLRKGILKQSWCLLTPLLSGFFFRFCSISHCLRQEFHSSSGWPQVCSQPPASASLVLGFKAWVMVPSWLSGLEASLPGVFHENWLLLVFDSVSLLEPQKLSFHTSIILNLAFWWLQDVLSWACIFWDLCCRWPVPRAVLHRLLSLQLRALLALMLLHCLRDTQQSLDHFSLLQLENLIMSTKWLNTKAAAYPTIHRPAPHSSRSLSGQGITIG